MEKVLLIAFITVFALLITAQAALTDFSVRIALNADDRLEGRPLGPEEYLYDEGEIVLNLLDGEFGEEIKVLLNGTEASDFSQSEISLRVKDGDVIEIDGSRIAYDSSVKTVSGSGGIRRDCLGKSVTVNSNTKALVKIRFN